MKLLAGNKVSSVLAFELKLQSHFDACSINSIALHLPLSCQFLCLPRDRYVLWCTILLKRATTRISAMYIAHSTIKSTLSGTYENLWFWGLGEHFSRNSSLMYRLVKLNFVACQDSCVLLSMLLRI